MKTWEMIKELTENPEKKFRIKSKALDTYVSVQDGIVVWKGEDQYGQSLIAKVDDEWEEVQEPVSFMEAVESGKSGRGIRVEHPCIDQPHLKESLSGEYQLLGVVLDVLSTCCSEDVIGKIILEGDWYVEDDWIIS